MNGRTPAAANGEGSGRNVGLVGDTFHVAHRTAEIQTARLRRRFALSPALAAEIAQHLHAVPEHWSCRT
ncbi:hypothetical protein SAMN05216360_1292 [Methylobacterium phyllostachyos]|uniref:Uncharacterized protein n=1 Tax=Methylobacterium phyllostachyos TaxID=582672 RepID=A0A1H0KSM3_9HYPH|nr:hypothetical protein SAMN05216360_1292 [Methylobacterium phyllostachyos]